MAVSAAILGSSMTFVSCNDFLDLKPQGSFTEAQLDDSSINGLMAAAYAGLESHSLAITSHLPVQLQVGCSMFVLMMP